MKTLKLRFNKAAIASIDGLEGHSITLLDAISGQLGQVMDIEVIVNVDSLRRPAIPFIDTSKINDETPAPQKTAKIINHPSNNVVEEEEKTRGRRKNVTHRIKANTKRGQMMMALTRLNKEGDAYEGITLINLAAEMGWQTKSPTSMLYSLPGQFGCELMNEVRADGQRYYWAHQPKHINLIFE